MRRVLRRLVSAFHRDPSWVLFLAFIFLAMLSMPLARAALLASWVAVLSNRAKRAELRFSGPTVGWLAYLALALVVSSIAAAFLDDPLLVPAKGLKKVVKLAWFAAIPLCAMQVNCKERFCRVLEMLALGGAVLALRILLIDTSYAWLQVHYPLPGDEGAGLALTIQNVAKSLSLEDAMQRWLADPERWAQWGGRSPCFFYSLLFNATLHDAQRLMVALVAAASLHKICRLGLIVTGLVLTCKRAPLAAAVISLGGMIAALTRPWKALLAAIAICLLAVAIPQSRARLQMMPLELTLKHGGRALMWTSIAPELHREHPLGIGFRSLTPEKMESIDRRVEPNRTHLHSSPIQAFIDFGWLGLAIWFAWMALSFREVIRMASGRGALSLQLPRSIRLMPLVAFTSIFLVSLVEYNIGDASVILLYGIVLGLGSAREIEN